MPTLLVAMMPDGADAEALVRLVREKQGVVALVAIDAHAIALPSAEIARQLLQPLWEAIRQQGFHVKH